MQVNSGDLAYPQGLTWRNPEDSGPFWTPMKNSRFGIDLLRNASLASCIWLHARPQSPETVGHTSHSPCAQSSPPVVLPVELCKSKHAEHFTVTELFFELSDMPAMPIYLGTPLQKALAAVLQPASAGAPCKH